MNIRSLFCRHKWTVLKEKRIPSLVEEASKLGYTRTGNTRSYNFIVQYTTIVTCECGAIKQFVNKTES